MRLDAVDRLCKNGKIEDMEIIINEKSLSNGTNVIQLETASGAAIKVKLINQRPNLIISSRTSTTPCAAARSGALASPR